MSENLNDTYYSYLKQPQKIAKIDLEKLKLIRSTKQLLKQKLRSQDLGMYLIININLEKTLSIPIRSFELESYKVGICLQNKDMDVILQKFMDPHKSNYVMYDDVLR